ncbi:DNA-3-methyladenine glycosylase 2 family protein [Rhodobacteraceae bacterium CCMM004]|nr:DNA-3-methyladenine glycosylase 2 family protein [Rhodobacteraceae bacterium CCMM004]
MSRGERVIGGPSCVAEGAAWLTSREPRFAAVLERTGPWPTRLRPPGFAGLAAVIVGQQVSTASAAAISGRMAAAGLTTPQAVAAADDSALRACGLSRPKMRYLRALAEADLDHAALARAPSDAARAALTAVPGIGVWTAEVYLLTCLGRADAFPAGDLALQEAARALFDHDVRPGAGVLARMAEPWRPWRAIAARGLWAYYRVVKGREGLS